MINLHLTRADNYEGIYLRLPATPAEIGEAFGWLDEISEDVSSTKILDAVSPVSNLWQYIKNTDVNNEQNIAALNELAQKIGEMDKQQKAVFSGALDAESIGGLDDVMEIADNLDRYILIHGISNDRELGGFLVDTGYKGFPEHVRPYLDYAGIGAEYYAERGGAYTSVGYVLRKEACQIKDNKDGAVFRLLLSTDRGDSLLLSLPATDEELDHAKERLKIDDFAQCHIDRTDCIPYLTEMVPNDCISVEVANDLAGGIDHIHQRDGELLKYLSVLEVEQPETFTQAYELIMSLDDYERMPDDLDEYGRAVLRRTGMTDEMIDSVDGYMDFALLGEHAMQEDGTRRTEFGLVRRLSEPFPEPEQGQQMM